MFGFVLWVDLCGWLQDLFWILFDLGQLIGMFIGCKLIVLIEDFLQCCVLFDCVGVYYIVLVLVEGVGYCGYCDGVWLIVGGVWWIVFMFVGFGIFCLVVVVLLVWEWNVVQFVVQVCFGQCVVSIDYFGSYNCWCIYGWLVGSWSEYLIVDVIDIVGF